MKRHIQACAQGYLMTCKSIRVTSYLHEALSNLKGEGESFQDLLRRLISSNRLTSFAVLWSGLSDDEKDRVNRGLRNTQKRSFRV
jgi:predicted CopG family antitoxin